MSWPTRDECAICARVNSQLIELVGELGFHLKITDIDVAALAGTPGLWVEFGHRLPVILLDGR